MRGCPVRSACEHMFVPSARQTYDWVEIRSFYDAGHSASECQARFVRLEPIADVLSAGRQRSRAHVKVRLLAAWLKQQRCENCGLSDWQGAPISLELHHVNGDGDDNRLTNLRLLCPNCHSQTDTWGAKNKGRHRNGH
jgi:hypothetical protein